MTVFIPETVPSTVEPPELQEYLFRELARIGTALETADSVRLPELSLAPTRPIDGDVIYADGTLFDPIGQGEGFYGYVNGGYVKLSLGVGDDPTFDLVTASRLRLTATDDASLASTLQALQIGASGAANIAMDANEIMARNNGAATTLFINNDGGLVSVGAGGITTTGNLAAVAGAFSGAVSGTTGTFSNAVSTGELTSGAGINSTTSIRSGNGIFASTPSGDMTFRPGGSGSAVGQAILSTAGALTLVAGLVATTGTFSGLLTTNGQVAFPAAQNASVDVNTLDDYEEGTLAPTISFATPGDLAVVYTLQVLTYVKVGLLVYIRVQLSFTPTFTTSAGAFQIKGLPFTVSSVAGSTGGGSMSNTNANVTWPAGATMLAPVPIIATTNVQVRGLGSGIASAFLAPANFVSGVATVFNFSLVYEATA